jgi:hypothetical protein
VLKGAKEIKKTEVKLSGVYIGSERYMDSSGTVG